MKRHFLTTMLLAGMAAATPALDRDGAQQGVVRSFDQTKGAGFIAPSNGAPDLPVQIGNVSGDIRRAIG